jgi:hypothetical protein
MRRTMMAALAAGSLLAGLASTHAAQALPGAKAPGSGTGSLVTDVRGGHGGGWGHGPRRGRGGGGRFYRGFYGLPFVGYGAYYGGGYSEGCGWIRRRAQATGGRYWWARYEDCIEKNY